jgi:hypothetical protein
MHHADIFGSVGDDKQLILWDTRKPAKEGKDAMVKRKMFIVLVRLLFVSVKEERALQGKT